MHLKPLVVRSIGNSQGVILPRTVMAIMDASPGTPLDYDVISGKLNLWILPHSEEKEPLCSSKR